MELINSFVSVIENRIFPSNTYFLKSRDTNNCIVIDPGLDKELVEQTIDELGVIPVAILVTHGHFDHIGSVSFLQKKYQIPYYLHEADLKLSKSANFYLKMAKIEQTITVPLPDKLFTNFHSKITIDEFVLNIYNYPGHSNGSCVIQYDDLLFSGDILYKKGLGFNNFPGEDKGKLKSSITSILNTFSDDCLILPGHGEAEHLGVIKATNHSLQDFIKVEI